MSTDTTGNDSAPATQDELFKRGSGVLCHVTSLPGPLGIGDFGESAYHFVDWLVHAGQRYWQLLPLTGVDFFNSPYASPSAFAGNPLYISLEKLVIAGYLELDEIETEFGFDEGQVDYSNVKPFRMDRLKLAAKRFRQQASSDQQRAFDEFCTSQAQWLDDYALFMSLDEAFGGGPWSQWDKPLAQRNKKALKKAAGQYADSVFHWKFFQWLFTCQWSDLRAYANAHGIRIIGDVPLFIAYHSADVWANPELFELDETGVPTVVAGVPPDYFSETGQLWGNPLYRWAAHEKQDFQWWVDRIRVVLEMVDLLRFDHFRGLSAYWEIPGDSETAIDGSWKTAPGRELLETLQQKLGHLPIIAEDLGVVTDEVIALRDAFDLPGMAVLQFAWGPGGERRFLPHNHVPRSIVYPGTHDNDTTVGWWEKCGEPSQHHVREYLSTDGFQPNWDMIRCAYVSVANLSIVTMQDLLGLNSEFRMNFPGKASGNWGWRFRWSDIPADLASGLKHLGHLYERI